VQTVFGVVVAFEVEQENSAPSGDANPTLVTVPVPAGRSAATSARKLGAAAPPEAGPAYTTLAEALLTVQVIAAAVVGLVTEHENSGDAPANETLVTVPVPVAEIGAQSVGELAGALPVLLATKLT